MNKSFPSPTSTSLAVAALLVSVISLYLSFRTGDKAEKLFYAKQLSKIQVTPIDFEMVGNSSENIPMARFNFQITNYTGFEAKDVRIDANLEGTWINEWFKAVKKGLDNKSEPLTELEKRDLKSANDSLKLHTFNLDSGQSKSTVFQGSFHYQPEKDNIIKIRVTWVNENNAYLDKCYSFGIIRTMVYDGFSFNPIPIWDKPECASSQEEE
jgi:hypothetical protein